MQVSPEMENPEAVDPMEYIQQKEEYEEKLDEFMRKHLSRAWPKRIVCVLGILQLLISLAILGVDLPIILMFAPRWQIFAGCWTFIFGFIACVSTLHSTRKITWLKLKWAVVFNILAGVAAAVMVAFDILFLVNPYMCPIIGGCSYLSYTYTAVSSFYTGQVVLGIGLLITAFIFLILFIKYGIGGTSLFEDIQKGWAPAIFKPIIPPAGAMRVPQPPPTGAGVMMNRPPPGVMPQHPVPGPYGPMPMSRPPGPMMMPRQPGPMMMPRQPGPMMMPRQPGPMMMPGQPGPMMMPGQPGSMMMPGQPGSMMMPGQPMIPNPRPPSRRNY